MIFENEKEKLVVGRKQTVKAIASGLAKKVFLASDCDNGIMNAIENLTSKDESIELYYIPTMKELGNMCGIDVKASCAVVLK